MSFVNTMHGKQKADYSKRLPSEEDWFTLEDLLPASPPLHLHPPPYNCPKNANKVIDFLKKIDSGLVVEMRRYLRENKGQLRQPNPPPKITNFEDIIIIYEFRMALQGLLTNPPLTKQQVGQKVHILTGRSKATILDRMKKKLCYLTPEDIQTCIASNAKLVFENRKKDDSKRNAYESMQMRKDYFEYLSETAEQAKHSPPKLKSWKQTGSKVEPIRPQETVKMEVPQPLKKQRVYKYGRKAVNQPIYICTHVASGIRKCLPAKGVSKFLENIRLQKQEVWKGKAEMRVKSQVDEAKEEGVSGETVSNQTDEDSQEAIGLIKLSPFKHFTPIQQLQADFLNSKFKETVKPQQTSKRESQGSDHIKEQQGLERNEESEQQQQQQEQDEDEDGEYNEQVSKEREREHKKLLYQLSNNLAYLELLSVDIALKQAYLWSQEEDEILYAFNFTPQQVTPEIRCLLKYKTPAVVIERMQFLGLDAVESVINHIEQLGRSGRDGRGKQQIQYMDIV